MFTNICCANSRKATKNFSEYLSDYRYKQNIYDFSPLQDEYLHQNNIEEFFNHKQIPSIQHNQWLELIEGKQVNQTDHLRLKNSVKQGLPKILRPRIWFWLAGVDNQQKQYSNDFFNKWKEIPSKWDNQIEKDTTRTFYEVKYLHKPQVQKRFRDILRVYSHFDGEVGYTQGMSYIVGALILSLCPDKYRDYKISYGKKLKSSELQEKTFYIFLYIMFEKNLRSIFKIGLQKVKNIMKYLDQRIQIELPAIYDKIQEFDLSMLLCFSEAYFTLMMYYAPPNFSYRIIDLFLIEGEQIIHDMIIRLLFICQKEILVCDQQEQLLAFLKKDLINYAYCKCQNQMRLMFPMAQSEVIIQYSGSQVQRSKVYSEDE